MWIDTVAATAPPQPQLIPEMHFRKCTPVAVSTVPAYDLLANGAHAALEKRFLRELKWSAMPAVILSPKIVFLVPPLSGSERYFVLARDGMERSRSPFFCRVRAFAETARGTADPGRGRVSNKTWPTSMLIFSQGSYGWEKTFPTRTVGGMGEGGEKEGREEGGRGGSWHV